MNRLNKKRKNRIIFILFLLLVLGLWLNVSNQDQEILKIELLAGVN